MLSATHILGFLVMAVFPGAMAYAAASDLMTMTITNRLQFVLLGAFALAAALAGMDLATVGWHVLAGFTVLAVSFTLFAFGWVGGGDAKLVAVTAMWFGFGPHLLDYILLSTFLGGVLTLAILGLRHLPMPALLAQQSWAVRLHDSKSGVPYGIALAAAALLVLPETAWMKMVMQ